MLQYNISNTTLFIVVGFLLVTLILGLYKGRGIKDIKEYALGGKNFSTITLTLTLLATYIGGGAMIGTVGEVYSFGIIVGLAYFGLIIQHLIIAFFIAPRISIFDNCLTLGDLAEKFYGKNAKILSGILSLFTSILTISIQLSILGKICSTFFNIEVYIAIFSLGLLLSIYSCFGGIKAVTYTDILQFLTILIFIPVISSILLKEAGGVKTVLLKIPKEKFNIINHKFFYKYLTFFLMVSIFPRMLISPPLIQRIFISNNKKQIKNQFLSASIIDVAFRVSIIFIGLCSIVLFYKINPKDIFPILIKNYLKNPFLKGVCICGLLAVIMSTADSYIHASGLVLFNDIFKPIFKTKLKKELLYLKIFTLFIGILSIFLSIYFTQGIDLRNITLLRAELSSPILLFPVLIGILGIKTDKKSFILSILGGLFFLYFSKFFLPYDVRFISIPIGIIFSGFTYLLSHIFQNKGIAWIQREEKGKTEKGGDKTKQKTKLWIPNPKEILQTIINYIPTPKKIYNYSRFQVMKNSSENIIFGIYCCVNFTLPYFLWDSQDPIKYKLMTNLRFVGGIMAGLLIVKDEWKKFLKPYYPLYWHATLTYCLPFITTVMFLLSGGSLLWLIQVAISIFFLIMLVAGEVFLILAPLGILLGLVFYKYFVGPINIFSLGFDINYYLIYAFFFPTIIGLLFAYKKKIFNKEISNVGINLGLSMCHEIRNTLSALSFSEMAVMKMNSVKNHTKVISEDGKKILTMEESTFDSIQDDMSNALGLNYDSLKVLTAFENLFIEYKKSNVNLEIDSVEETVRDTLRDLHFLPDQLERIELDLRDDFFIQLPKAQFAFVLSNIIRNAFKHGGPSKVEIRSENNKLIIRDNGKGIPESDTEKIFQMGYTTGKKEESSGTGLWFSKIIIMSFNGEISCNSQQGKNSYTEFTIKFPEIEPSKITEGDRKRINIKKSKRLKYLGKLEITKTMIEKGDSIDKIEERTRLSSSEIKEIQKKMKK